MSEVFSMKDMCPAPEEQSSVSSFVDPLSPTGAVSSSAVSYGAVMPAQFFGVPHRSDTGVAALMYAMLEDALVCFAKQFVESGGHDQCLAKEAERWFFSDNERWPFSFVNVCLVLRIDPGYVRVQLRELRRRPPTRLKRKKQHVGCRTRSL
jgi:hypothetical protein